MRFNFQAPTNTKTPRLTHLLLQLTQIVIVDHHSFNQVKPEVYQPRLLQIKGTSKNVRAFQVPLEIASLNQGDSFILDAGLQIFVRSQIPLTPNAFPTRLRC